MVVKTKDTAPVTNAIIKAEPDVDNRHSDVDLEPWASLLQASFASPDTRFPDSISQYVSPLSEPPSQADCAHSPFTLTHVSPTSPWSSFQPHSSIPSSLARRKFFSPVHMSWPWWPHTRLCSHSSPHHSAHHFPSPPWALPGLSFSFIFFHLLSFSFIFFHFLSFFLFLFLCRVLKI